MFESSKACEIFESSKVCEIFVEGFQIGYVIYCSSGL
jgi:hypothetical protein